MKQRFLELADLESVTKAAVVLNLPSKLRLGSKLVESRWVYFTVTVAEVANYLRIDPWDCMQEFFVKGLSDGKFAYAFPARDDLDQWSVDTAYWSLYLAHAAKQEHLISPEMEPSGGEQKLISAKSINIDYYDYDQATQVVRFIAELGYDQYFSLRDYQYLLRLAREREFRYDVPLYTDEGRVKYGNATNLDELVEQARRQFRDRPYSKVDFIIRDEEGANEYHALLKALGFGVFYMEEKMARIWEYT